MRTILSAVIAVVLSTVVAVVWMGIGTAEAKNNKLKHRTPDEVISALQDALAASDWDVVASQYAADAFMIDDQGILVGPAEIVESLMSWDCLLDDAQPQISQEDFFEDTVRVLYEIDAGWFVIPDGVDTFVIENGLIQRQVRHGLIEFTGPPPDSDSDGLADHQERCDTGTNPNDPDTDDDGFNDLDEIEADTDPNDPTSFPAP